MELGLQTRAPRRCELVNLSGQLSQGIQVTLLTGGRDPHYAEGLARALAANGVRLDFIGSDVLESSSLRAAPGLRFLNLRGSQRQDASLPGKIARVLTYYFRLLRYSAVAKPKIFHILWNNRFETLDRTLMMLYYKALGKKVVLTVHNVNAGKRDGNDSLLNRLTLRIQYQLADHLFVHTEAMENELAQDFGVRKRAVTVIPFGINNIVPDTELTVTEAKQRLGIRNDEKTILFFGAIQPYKGVEYLLAAFQLLVASDRNYRLIIAGEVKRESRRYAEQIGEIIEGELKGTGVIQRFEFIPDEEVELYFKAADLLVLPYKEIFQSGVLFLAYCFGLPVVATDVGSLREEIIEGRTGFLCPPENPGELAQAIRIYFQSDCFKELPSRRGEIREFAGRRHAWNAVSEQTRNVYTDLLAGTNHRTCASSSPREP
jgi:D-inositol-3-phosphate glycosyltransferase